MQITLFMRIARHEGVYGSSFEELKDALFTRTEDLPFPPFIGLCVDWGNTLSYLEFVISEISYDFVNKELGCWCVQETDSASGFDAMTNELLETGWTQVR